MATLGLIPARGGSKGIPRKNIRPMAGKPLIAWTIEAALSAATLDHVVVTTDDREIAAVAINHGADIPFMRPAELARDETPGIDPVLHALDMLTGFDAVVLLQPTSPMRIAADIDAAVSLAASRGNSTVVSVTALGHVGWEFAMDQSGMLDVGRTEIATRRQDLASRFALNGAIYVAQSDWLRKNRTFLAAGTLGYEMPPERSIDIDTTLDWQIAEMLLKDRA